MFDLGLGCFMIDLQVIYWVLLLFIGLVLKVGGMLI